MPSTVLGTKYAEGKEDRKEGDERKGKEGERMKSTYETAYSQCLKK